MSALHGISGPRRGGAPVHRASIANRLKQSFDLNVLSTVRRMLLALAVLGLLFTPPGSFAHGAMNDSAVVAMTDHAPCCPHDQPDDCPKCALASLCGSYCLNFLAMALEAPVAATSVVALSVAPQSQSAVVGIKHAPPRRPPRA